MGFRTKREALISVRESGCDFAKCLITILQSEPLNEIELTKRGTIDELIEQLKSVDFAVLNQAIADTDAMLDESSDDDDENFNDDSCTDSDESDESEDDESEDVA
ncbi:MAG: hypothetical protein HYV97_13680 [Bdellovibrio sp.]|nr:hypothetical protein [Bdellovibrio sp.]